MTKGRQLKLTGKLREVASQGPARGSEAAGWKANYMEGQLHVRLLSGVLRWVPAGGSKDGKEY